MLEPWKGQDIDYLLRFLLSLLPARLENNPPNPLNLSALIFGAFSYPNQVIFLTDKPEIHADIVIKKRKKTLK